MNKSISSNHQLIHKAAAMVVRDNAFIMVRKVGKDVWTSLGGHIEAGESEEQALLREIKEEVSCDAKILRKLGDFEDKAAFDDATLRLSVFLVELKGPIKLSDPELEEVGWVPKDYRTKNIKLTPIITNKVIPMCINEGILKW